MIFNFSKPQLTSEITTAIPCAEPTRSDSSEELSKLQFTPERVFTGFQILYKLYFILKSHWYQIITSQSYYSSHAYFNSPGFRSAGFRSGDQGGPAGGKLHLNSSASNFKKIVNFSQTRMTMAGQNVPPPQQKRAPPEAALQKQSIQSQYSLNAKDTAQVVNPSTTNGTHQL